MEVYLPVKPDPKKRKKAIDKAKKKLEGARGASENMKKNWEAMEAGEEKRAQWRRDRKQRQ